MEESLREDVIDYLATIGLRAKDSEVNRNIYKTLVRITFKVIEYSKIDPMDYLYFLDCVAHNILGVGVFNCPAGEYKINLESRNQDKKLSLLYRAMEIIKEQVINNHGMKL